LRTGKLGRPHPNESSVVADAAGSIYDKDLGKSTGNVTATMTSFDPDSNWKEVANP
jgi:hypothetical protein